MFLKHIQGLKIKQNHPLAELYIIKTIKTKKERKKLQIVGFKNVGNIL